MEALILVVAHGDLLRWMVGGDETGYEDTLVSTSISICHGTTDISNGTIVKCESSNVSITTQILG